MSRKKATPKTQEEKREAVIRFIERLDEHKRTRDADQLRKLLTESVDKAYRKARRTIIPISATMIEGTVTKTGETLAPTYEKELPMSGSDRTLAPAYDKELPMKDRELPATPPDTESDTDGETA